MIGALKGAYETFRKNIRGLATDSIANCGPDASNSAGPPCQGPSKFSEIFKKKLGSLQFLSLFRTEIFSRIKIKSTFNHLKPYIINLNFLIHVHYSSVLNSKILHPSFSIFEKKKKGHLFKKQNKLILMTLIQKTFFFGGGREREGNIFFFCILLKTKRRKKFKN
jgi:hypothetical protein